MDAVAGGARVTPDAAGLAPKIRAAFEPCSLGDWPTPLVEAPALGAALGGVTLWIKREDRSARPYGGNKVRGLEFLLPGAPPGAVFVTLGGTGSTHCLATAVHARRLGWRTAVAQFPQPSTEWADAVAAVTAAHADVLARAGTRIGLPLAVARAWLGARRLGTPRWLPGGGAHPRAVVGHLLAALELAGQLPTPPDALVVPLGTGSTAAGLLLGLACLGWSTGVVAVRIAPALVANRWRTARLASQAHRLLAQRGIRVPLPRSLFPVVLDGAGGGYGHPSPQGEAARVLAEAQGLVLDSTYGGKALAALPSVARLGFRRVVFWNTFAPPPPMAESGR